jgi:hypothetical protein|nr:MAG TPA: tail protein [Caudoviricetes sp.]
MTLWHRQYKVVFPDIGIEYANTLRITFEVEKDLTKETNKSKLSIFNLAPGWQKKLEVADLKVEIWAGYKDNTGPVRIFTGTVISAQTKPNGNNVETELTLSDGQVAIRDTAFTLSFAPGTAGNTILQYIANAMGLPLILGEKVQFGTFTDGYSFVGTPRAALDGICYHSGCSWSIQNESLQVILNGGVLANRGLVFATDSGLIGSPERIVKANSKADTETAKRRRTQKAQKERPEKQAGWKIKTLLAPTVTPGDAVKVESREITGWFRVESVKHQGDSYSGEWTSEINLIERLTYTDGTEQ